MKKETINYRVGNQSFKGYLVYDERDKKPKPGVLVAHAWRGQDDFARKKAEALAELGYIALATDVYGDGKSVTTDEEAQALMFPLFLDRKLLLERITGAYDLLKKQPHVDPKRIGGIGFCFGGLTIIELFRSGADLRGAVSFHGVLGNSLGGKQAAALPIAKGIKGSLLILHGHNDPLVSAQDIQNVQNELTKSLVDWEMNIYGHASHAFTNPEVHDDKKGLSYNPKADHRSWRAMCDFFEEVFA